MATPWVHQWYYWPRVRLIPPSAQIAESVHQCSGLSRPAIKFIVADRHNIFLSLTHWVRRGVLFFRKIERFYQLKSIHLFRQISLSERLACWIESTLQFVGDLLKLRASHACSSIIKRSCDQDWFLKMIRFFQAGRLTFLGVASKLIVNWCMSAWSFPT